MTAPIRELEVVAATCDRDFGVVVQSGRSSKGRIAAADDRANTSKAQAFKTLDKMPELRPLFKGLNQTVGGKRVRVAGLNNAELVRVQPVFTVSMSESDERMVSEAICTERDGFPGEASSDARGPSAGGSSYRSQVWLVV